MENNECFYKAEQLLAIVSFYDPDGIVEDYFIFYLSSLKEVANRIIVVVNGKLTVEGRMRIEWITNEIYIRDNLGFDFGAYKDVIESYLSPSDIKQYGQLILCNDTCFGPFIPFKDIFAEMNKVNLDFWAITYMNHPLLPHFQSYFMVFHGKAIKLVTEFLKNEVDSREADINRAYIYEQALSEIILEQELQSDYYVSHYSDEYIIDIYRSPDWAIKSENFPFLKKKIFSNQNESENCMEALRLIHKMGNYPLCYILDYVNRRYQRNYVLEEILQVIQTPRQTEKIIIGEESFCSREKIIKFCSDHKRIFVFGNGKISDLWIRRYGRYMREFGGYIVSDEYYKDDIYRGDKVYRLNQIREGEAIIVAMSEKHTGEIIEKLSGREKVLLLSAKWDRYVSGNISDENK